eukprot:4901385-Prymnesium_polylepis.1
MARHVCGCTVALSSSRVCLLRSVHEAFVAYEIMDSVVPHAAAACNGRAAALTAACELGKGNGRMRRRRSET